MDGSPPIIILGAQSQCGAYILRIRLAEALTLRFGRFKKGKPIPLRAGEYTYVGSARSLKGATSLRARLLRHATRTSDKPPHQIREDMVEHFKAVGLGKGTLPPKREKRLFWNVDYLLNQPSAEIITAFVIRSDKQLEAELGRLLEKDPHTVVFERGLGANDVPGATHILCVKADETWWRNLRARLEAFV